SGAHVRANDVFIDDEDQLYVTMNTAEVELKSTPLMEDVVAQLQLDKNATFTQVTQRKTFSESLSDVVGKIRRDPAPARPAVFRATAPPPKISGARTPEEVERLAPYVGIVEGSLRIRPIVDTRIMT